MERRRFVSTPCGKNNCGPFPGLYATAHKNICFFEKYQICVRPRTEGMCASD